MTRISTRKGLFLVFNVCFFLSFLVGWYLRKQVDGVENYSDRQHTAEVTETLPSSNGLEAAKRSRNNAFVIDTLGCRIPNLDPYDASVFRFLSTQKPLVCPGKPLFMLVQPNGSLSLNETTLKALYKLNPRDVSCFYRSIRRKYEKPGHFRENDYFFGKKSKLKFGKPLHEDHVVVDCILGKENLTQFIPIPRLIKEVEDEKSSKTSLIPHLNIIIVGVDSISKLNFIRHFRKTNALFKDKLFPFEMKGYTKVGDNSFPNIFPLLSGRFPWDVWNETVKDIMFFDEVPLIWKPYAEKGYRTFFSEDMSHYGTFNYGKRGFHNQPTDYYFRPLTLAIYQSALKKKSKRNCLNSQTETDIMYDYLKDFVRTMGPRPFFSFTMVSSLTHDYLNNAAYADEPTFRLLEHLWNNGALNNSVLVFFSDHGLRFGGIQKTYIGKFEERLPFMYLHFPDWFLNHYPHFSESLRKNQERLVTVFDVHATLSHLLEPYKKSYKGNISLTPYGSSLLNEISEYRTCEKAHILAPWCVCQVLHPESLNDPSVVASATAVINFINQKLKPYRALCAVLEVDLIKEAQYGQISDLILRFVKHENVVINRYVEYGKRIETYIDYVVKVTAKPNSGFYEGTVRFNTITDAYNVLHVNIIHASTDNSKCVGEQDIRFFCHCLS